MGISILPISSRNYGLFQDRASRRRQPSEPLTRLQFAVFDLQSRTGLPAPLGAAIKTTPELLDDSAFLPAAGPAPVYLSICGPLIRPPMSCATAIEETVLHALVAGRLNNVTVPVGIEVGSVAIEALGVTGI